ncbi:MAG: hypothetical protein WEB53_09890 [Akkermansiaceae bacterium]
MTAKNTSLPISDKLSRAALAEMAGVSPRTLTNWRRDEGINLDDTAAVLLRAKDVVKADEGKDTALRAAKLRKIELECQRIESAIARENEMFLPTLECLEAAKCVGTVFRLRMLEMAGRLPGILAGLSAGEIHKTLIREIDGELEAISRLPLMPENSETKRLTAKIHRHENNRKTKKQDAAH